MKSYNGLMAQMLEHDEVVASIEETAEGRTERPVVKRTLKKKDEKADKIIHKIRTKTWRPPTHPVQFIQEGAHKKKRNIQKPRFDDEQIVHHMTMRQFRKVVEPRLYRYAYGSLPGRGSHEAAAQMKRWRDEYGNHRFYVFEGDVRKFYDNVDTDLLKGKLHRRIRDKDFVGLLELIIDRAGPGLPKGFYTSPWFATFYMEEFDNFVVQVLKPDHYLRYMDNIYIYNHNKKELHRMVRQIILFLAHRLHLELKDDWQVFRFEGETGRSKAEAERHPDKKHRPPGRAINALGFVIHRDRVTIRKSNLKRTRAKANHIHKRQRYTRHDCASMLSRVGNFKHANVYGYYLRHIKPVVSITYCKKRISIMDKKRHETRSEAA